MAIHSTRKFGRHVYELNRIYRVTKMELRKIITEWAYKAKHDGNFEFIITHEPPGFLGQHYDNIYALWIRQIKKPKK